MDTDEHVQFIDIENRAYFLTVMNQRWLAVRLDFFGSVLTFIVAMTGVAGRFTISPAQTGLLLSYILTIQAAFSWMVRQGAEVEVRPFSPSLSTVLMRCYRTT
jgi:ATP-binding cassette subfamily C (CFTR/MRP) protein 1